MKITLLVLFFVGITIYCKCASVLSLPPSLIAHAASLEKTQKSLPAQNGRAGEDTVASAVFDAQDGNEVGASHDGHAFDGVLNSQVLYTNFKKMLQNNFGIHKRERNTFDGGRYLDVETAGSIPTQLVVEPQQHETIKAINSNKNSVNVNWKPRLVQTMVDESSNMLKPQVSATIKPLHIDNAAAEYGFNKWFDEDSGSDIMLDGYLGTQTFFSPIKENENDDADDTLDDTNFQTQSLNRPFPKTVDQSDNDTADVIKDDVPIVWSNFLRPFSNYSPACLGEKNCPTDYYSTVIAARNNALEKHLQHAKSSSESFQDSDESLLQSTLYPTTPNNINNDDIVLLLTAEQRLLKFLSWALAELYPFGKFSNVSENSAESYDPGLYLWKTLNLSGRLEPPLFVEEPQYVMMRKEYDAEEDTKRGGRPASLHHDDPFIPPRGRKHNLPDLDSLLQRYETFVPNRGRRDKIKDIFKYDDVFYPNRGKRTRMCITSANSPHDDDSCGDENKSIQSKKQQQISKGETKAASLLQMQLNQHLLTKTLEQINNVMAKVERKLHRAKQQHQKRQPNTFDEMMSNSQPTAEISTTNQQDQLNKRLKPMVNILQQQRKHYLPNKNLNSRRQWWKRYSTMDNTDGPTISSTPAVAASSRSRSLASNRLHSLRSMSPQQMQQQRLLTAEDLATSHPRLQRQYNQTQQTPEYTASSRLYQNNKILWQAQQPYNQQGKSAPATSFNQDFDPLSWHKLQIPQHQFYLPLLTMRHPRLTLLQHWSAGNSWQQQDEGEDVEMTTARKVPPQISSTDSTPFANANAVANDLNDIYKIEIN